MKHRDGEGTVDEVLKNMERISIKLSRLNGTYLQHRFYNEPDEDDQLAEIPTSDWFDIGDK